MDVIWFPRILVAGELLRPNSYRSDGDDGIDLGQEKKSFGK